MIATCDDCKILKWQNFKNARIYDCKISRFHTSKTSKMQKVQYFITARFQDTKFQRTARIS